MMKTEQATIRQREGLHLRVAAEVVKLAQNYDAEVTLQCDDCPLANACSILDLMMLGAPCGRKIRIQAEGPDEDKVVQELAEYFNHGSGI